VEISERAGALTISGGIRIGDDIKLNEALARQRAQPLRVIYLNSGGGRVSVATQMGRAIRRAGLTTAVNGSGRCESACTLLFASGRQRHYFNARSVADRLGRPGGRGLGYHGGNDLNATGRGRQADPSVTANMIGFYHEMGVSGAAEFVNRAAHDQMYYISPATALARGIATSLSPP